jgi:hypothetical protein
MEKLSRLFHDGAGSLDQLGIAPSQGIQPIAIHGHGRRALLRINPEIQAPAPRILNQPADRRPGQFATGQEFLPGFENSPFHAANRRLLPKGARTHFYPPKPRLNEGVDLCWKYTEPF